MSKFKITLFLIVTVFFLNNCGFTPQYAGFKGLDFSLKINEINGDRDLNNAIRSQLDRYYINDPKLNTINVKIESKFTKDTLSKDSTGKATKYNLIANVKFILDSEKGSRTVTFKEEFKIDNIEDTVEENNYIRIIKRNFAEIISEKLILNINQD
tara:strand:- start:1701 stop:2165 length:465 start_codon:yes stop_codon:yes gene_type:complete